MRGADELEEGCEELHERKLFRVKVPVHVRGRPSDPQARQRHGQLLHFGWQMVLTTALL